MSKMQNKIRFIFDLTNTNRKNFIKSHCSFENFIYFCKNILREMATSNNQTNELIRWIVILTDFFLLNLLIWLFVDFLPEMKCWTWEMKWAFLFANNLALFVSEMRFSTIVHRRVISAGDVVQRVIGLVLLQFFVAYLLLSPMSDTILMGKIMLMFAPPFFALLILSRLFERWMVKRFRRMGRNSRSVTFVGNDPELLRLYDELVNDSTTGYRIRGYYADAEIGDWTYSQSSQSRMVEGVNLTKEKYENIEIKRLGSLQDLLRLIEESPDEVRVGAEMYVSLSRRDRDIIKKLSRFCDRKVIRFFYVPVSVETLGINLKPELLNDMEVYASYENPLQNIGNRFIKRMFDIVLSIMFLIPTAILFPFIYLIIKIQSPGPILFKQLRTGIDGQSFNCYKFRSMHVNKDADKLQATKDDPRKFPFGNFMRKANIDELPQFLNVLQGRMSIVGPRPHMLAHTEQYSQLIDKYMVRHFVKPGVTGWAQVTGYRGETKELWQMEGRVKRDIWYIEHWSIWLDIRIIWLTAKSIFIHDKNAY